MKHMKFYQSKVNLLLISLVLSLSVLFGFSMQRNLSIETPIRIIDFRSMESDALLAWGQENDIQIKTTEEYSEDVVAGMVISQSSIVGERLYAGSTINVVLSKGPDPEVIVNLIDFTGKDIGEIQLFIEENKLMAAEILFEKSDAIQSAYYIKKNIDAESIQRKTPIKFYISTGSKDELTTVSVPDFTEYTRQQISTWSSTNNIKANFVEEFHDTVAAGKVISQSQAANTQVYDGSSITFKMSLGVGVVLENFVGKTKGAIDKFISDNGLKVNYSFSYNATQNKDVGVSMSPNASVRVPNGSTVDVTLSLGKISVSDFTGKTLSQLNAWVSEQNKLGANLKVTSTQDYSATIASGQLISQTPSSGDINPGTSIRASVSKGEGVVVKNFVGGTSTSQEGLKVSTSQTYHASVPSGQVISQSISSGSKVDTNTSISLVISLGKVQVGSYSSLGDLEAWKNNVNGSGANISISKVEEWNDKPAGSLVSHTSAGASVNPGTTITAVVSRGPSVTVKNYVSENSRDQDGLTENFEEVNNSAAAGTVIGQSISAGQVVARGTSIKITISKGPVVVKMIKVPQVSYITGLSSSAATSASMVNTAFSQNAPGLTPNIIYGSYDKSCGNIHDVDPDEDTPLPEGSVVNVYIENVNCK